MGKNRKEYNNSFSFEGFDTACIRTIRRIKQTKSRHSTFQAQVVGNREAVVTWEVQFWGGGQVGQAPDFTPSSQHEFMSTEPLLSNLHLQITVRKKNIYIVILILQSIPVKCAVTSYHIWCIRAYVLCIGLSEVRSETRISDGSFCNLVRTWCNIKKYNCNTTS